MVCRRSFVAFYIGLIALTGPTNAHQNQDAAGLDEGAFEEAQQRDDTATRAFSDIQIRTSDGRCLFTDKLAGDFRANLAPIELAECGSTDGQGWDIITAGKHNDQPGRALIVSTLTQACISADPRRVPGTQIHMFSCGGRADGSGEVADSQLFAFDGGEGPLILTPQNGEGFCLTPNRDLVDVDDCGNGRADQEYTLGEGPSNPDESGSNNDDPSATPTSPVPGDGGGDAPAVTTSIPTESPSEPADNGDSEITNPPPAGALPTSNPTTPVPVSRAGGSLRPEDAAESHQFDDTAVRPLEGVNIRVPGAENVCLSVDPTAGDFRQNLIPVGIVACADVPNQKFDVVTSGLHNNGDLGGALLVSALTEGCISFDGRRQDGDTVTIFSCGGRADGEGETDRAQLYPFDGSNNIILKPESGDGEICLVAGEDRLISAGCSGDASQVFELV